ncbi:DUF6434 domain-containing protein [Micromonospora sp. WMMA1998]|uniref:DUF6434 domain-containing protein n=1 Tax=Micromonospora sp. WMMA1998 TaxID=3015167 RepID=UPI00248BA1E6|nr:DUF6434 domain-containing protein [Micromonospora sp. WMMA1998]WBC16709.1 DUF6434 domain-containing protein [Micromonospora sp. WMMA1998]
MTDRPPLTHVRSGTELRRWYWTLAELTELARTMGVPRGGGKLALIERLAAALDGTAAPEPPRRAGPARQLDPPVTVDTVIPAGQRCGQVLREFFRRQVGKEFVFDEFMRAFIRNGAGRTLGDAVSHWYDTRAEAARERPVAAQFEFNAFLRQWRRVHPRAGRAAALAAWQEHRSRPVEERPGPLRTNEPSTGEAC